MDYYHHHHRHRHRHRHPYYYYYFYYYYYYYYCLRVIPQGKRARRPIAEVKPNPAGLELGLVTDKNVPCCTLSFLFAFSLFMFLFFSFFLSLLFLRTKPLVDIFLLLFLIFFKFYYKKYRFRRFRRFRSFRGLQFRRLVLPWKGLFRFLLTGIFGITSGGGPHISVGIFRPKFAVPFLINRFFALIREFGRRI